ncbi:MAG TPA: hypothetical protein VMY88_03190 [Acidimicrobiales bacterium]|nr:hypothetical protein [Acidimicrobiales bacterium]
MARRRFLVAICALACLALGPSIAAAQTDGAPVRKHVNVLSVTGLVDSVVLDSIYDAIDRAEAEDALTLILQLDSTGAVVPPDDFEHLITALDLAKVPIGVWVGPAGSSAEHAATRLLEPADLRGRAPGTRVGPGVDHVIQAPTLGDFVVSLDGVKSRAGVLSTAKVEVNAAGEPRRKPLVDVRFVEPTLMARLLHIVASPAVSYLLLLAGAGLVLLELFSLGGGLAAGTAVVCLLLSAYGLAELPTRPLGLGLMLVAIVAFGVDIQAGTARFWTALGTLALLVGTLTLFGRGLDGPVGLPWPAAAFGILGLLLLVIRAMPSIVRSRTTAGGLNPTALAAAEASE